MTRSDSDKNISRPRSPQTTSDETQETQSVERQSFLELTRSLAGLPLEHAAAALETSAAIASISLRAGIEFLRAAPAAAEVLAPSELRSWGDMGRRLAMSDFESAAAFFAAGVAPLKGLPPALQAAMIQLCLRQMTLSTAVGRETFRTIPELARAVDDHQLLQAILDVAAEIARRSAKHSAEFLNSSERVAQALKSFHDQSTVTKALALAGDF